MMRSWSDLVRCVEALPNNQDRSSYIQGQQHECLRTIGKLRGGRHVIAYASAFLQKPNASAENVLVTHEDINGFVSVTYGMECQRGLSLILHTPGGHPAAADSIVAYVRSKFRFVEVIVPALAISAGAMISLAADRLVMDRQSELGPIDPQIGIGGGRSVSARAVVELFERAREDVVKDGKTADAWAPITQSLGPSLLQEAHSALHDSEKMVARWLEAYMFADRDDPKELAKSAAHYFSEASRHWNQGRRIGRDEARANDILVEDLEADHPLQEAVLTSHYLMAISFEKSLATKILSSDTGLRWMKNLEATAAPAQVP